jgi:TetR/AcrR family tetracycline transcriptional repressor
MGRPKVPLLSRDLILTTAVRIVDNEGLDSLSIRRLADELSVNGASLYYHFANKDEIVVGAAELALERTPIRIGEFDSDWRKWMVGGARQLRDLLLTHPHFVPVIVRRRSFGVADRNIDVVVRRLLAHSVAPAVIVPMLDALEQFIIGTALRAVAHHDVESVPHVAPELIALATVTAVQLTDEDEIFDAAILGLIDSVVALGSPSPAAAADKKPARRQAAVKPTRSRSKG